jgi:hypothetical protein
MLFWFSFLKMETGSSGGLKALKVLTGSVRPWISVSPGEPVEPSQRSPPPQKRTLPRLVRTARRNAGLQMN